MSDMETASVFAPVSVKTGKPIELAMQRLWLAGKIMGVGARLLVKHTFRSAEKKPLEVIYSFGLPRDAALRRFRITGEGFSVTSDLKPVEKVRETYEEALAEGHLAAMAAQYGDGVVNLTVGNIRPGEEVSVNLEIVAGVETRDDGIRFRFPFTLAPAYHSRARAAEVAPGVGEFELPSDEFGDLVLPQFVSDASALHEVGFDLAVSMGHPIRETSSPSHPVRVVEQGIGRDRVSLATAKDLPDRDLVLDIRTDGTMGGVVAGTGKDGRGYFGAVVPSSAFKVEAEGAEGGMTRRIVFVLDRSGSMQGAAIKQAKKAVEVCLGALGEKDSFGIVAFDDGVEYFGSGLSGASMKNRESARKFLEKIDARGGTELAAAITAAATILGKGGDGGGGGNLFVVTDGQVMGTEKILEVARAKGLRLHCLGIGSASQDRFLALLARETGGVSRFLTPRERVDLGAVELFASVGRPLATKPVARIEGFEKDGGRIEPGLPADVFGGTPVVLFGDTSGPGEGRLVLEWEDGTGKRRTMAVPLAIGAGGDGETVRLLQGARLITDFESRYPGGPYEPGAAKAREAERIRKRLVALGEAYGLANREMGLVAVVERAGDRPGDIPVTRVVPVGMAQDVMMAGYFNVARSPSAIVGHAAYDAMLCSDIELVKSSDNLILRAPSFRPARGRMKPPFSIFGRGRSGATSRSDKNAAIVSEAGGRTEEDALLEIAANLEPDGGLPGKFMEDRVLATVLAVLRFLAEGHGESAGAFRAHVKRMLEFLEKSKVQNDVVKQIVERGRSGRVLPGDWAKKQPYPALWAELEEALKQNP
jgi:Ca-activated chloride channel family protein